MKELGEEVIDSRYNKQNAKTKIAVCSKCGTKHLLEKQRLSFECQKCGKKHSYVFEVVTK